MVLGQEAAAELQKAATAGSVTLTPEAAHELAAHYQWFADEMTARQRDVRAVAKLDGFGTFGSASDLQKGFESKATQAFNAFKTAEESAYHMGAAILKAAGLLREADASNASAIHAASKMMLDDPR